MTLPSPQDNQCMHYAGRHVVILADIARQGAAYIGRGSRYPPGPAYDKKAPAPLKVPPLLSARGQTRARAGIESCITLPSPQGDASSAGLYYGRGSCYPGLG